MTTFSVDPHALQALAGRLRHTGDELAAAGRTLRSDDAGAPGVDDALRDLVHAWRRGLERTGEAAGRTAAQLRAAAEVYGDVEAQITQACP